MPTDRFHTGDPVTVYRAGKVHNDAHIGHADSYGFVVLIPNVGSVYMQYRRMANGSAYNTGGITVTRREG